MKKITINASIARTICVWLTTTIVVCALSISDATHDGSARARSLPVDYTQIQSFEVTPAAQPPSETVDLQGNAGTALRLAPSAYPESIALPNGIVLAIVTLIIGAVTVLGAVAKNWRR